jgi:hypothetical protein
VTATPTQRQFARGQGGGSFIQRCAVDSGMAADGDLVLNGLLEGVPS